MVLRCLLAAESALRAEMAPPDTWLTLSEAERFASLGSSARRDTFLAGRWLARRAVRQWLASSELPALAVASSGACHVIGRRDVFVSISHSAGQVACAVAGVPVGVDVESVARPRDHLALAETVHGAAQHEQLARLPPEARALPFLQWWTLKEAWLKARERGLDFATMRALSFDDNPAGDVAVARLGDLMLAVAADPALPARLEIQPPLAWQRLQATLSAA